MPRGPGRKKDPNTSHTDLEPNIGDITDKIFPEGVPKNLDGSLASDGNITIQEAKKIGSVSPESARLNKANQKKIAKRMAGELHIAWGESEALQLFDSVKLAFPNSFIHISKTEPQPLEDYRPIPLSSFKNSQEFYDYVERNIHKISVASTYHVKFKEASQERGRGNLRLPDTTSNVQTKGFENMGNPLTPFGFGYPPPQGFPQPSYPPQYAQQYQQQYPVYPPNYAGYPPNYSQAGSPAPPPPVAAPPPPPPPPAPPPAPAPVEPPPTPPRTYARPENHYTEYPPVPSSSFPNGYQNYQYPPQAVPIAAPVADPAMQQAMIQAYQETQRMQQLMHQNQLQLERALGAIEEMKRQQFQQPQQPQYYQQPVTPPAPTPPAPQQNNQPQQNVNSYPIPQMPPEMVAPQQQQYQQPQMQQPQMQYPQHPGYLQGPQGYYPPQGFHPGMNPYYQQQYQQPNPQNVQAAVVAANPLAEIQKATTMISGFSKAMREIKHSLSGEVNSQGEVMEDEMEENPLPLVPAQPPPFETMPLGMGPNPPMMAYNKDGSIHMLGTVLGNAPKIVDLVNGITKAISQAQELQKAQGGSAHVSNPQPQMLLPQRQPQMVNPSMMQSPYVQQQYQMPRQQTEPLQATQQSVPQEIQVPVEQKQSSLVPMTAFRPNI